MGFITKVRYNRQLEQFSGKTSGTSYTATFSGDTHILQDLWVGLPPYTLNHVAGAGYQDYAYSGNSGYTFIVQQAGQKGYVSNHSYQDIYADGRYASHGVSITTFSGLSTAHTVVAIGQAPLPPPNPGSATLALTASSLQIAWGSLIASSAQDVGIDTNGNIVRDSSSQKYKKDIEDFKFKNLDKLLELKPKKFKWKTSNSEDWGYIAEEVDALGLTDFVHYNGGQIESVKYKKLAILIIEYLKQYGSVKSTPPVECKCPKDEFIVLEEDTDYMLDSSETHKVIVKSLATCSIIPDKGLIDTQWESLEMLPESCVEFRYYEPLSSWMIVSSDGIKES